MKAKRVKRKSKIKIIISTFIMLAIFILILIYLYNIYKNIDINNFYYETEKVQSTINEQKVENIIEKSETITDILEKTMKSVVGISKLKDNGSSIFSNNNETSLGLGTGIIVTGDGYILSNEHVTGSKFSTCYITLENGKKYEGKVVWSDCDLDLSISKIDVTDLEYVTLGDSDNVRIGETVYAIGNPIRF